MGLKGSFDSLVALLLLLCGLGSFGFVSIMNVLGLAHYGVVWSACQTIYSLFLAFVSMIVFVSRFFKKSRLSKAAMLLLLYLAVFVMGFMITATYSKEASEYFLLFLANAIPGAVAGMVLADLKYRDYWWKYIDVVVLLLTLSVLSFFAQSSTMLSSYGVDYQVASYMAAVAYGLNICSQLFGPSEQKFRFFGTKAWGVASFVLCLFQAAATFYTGGRGGALLVVLFTIVGAVVLLRRGISGRQLALLSLLLAGALLVSHFIAANIDQAGVSRIFSYYDNRTAEYALVWNKFLSNPFFGYGPYGYHEAIGIIYPHNIVLELLLTFGVAGIPFVLFFVAVLATRLRQGAYKGVPKWVFVIGVYAMVRLFVSSTLLSFASFWFVLGFLANAEKQDSTIGE